MVYALDEFGGPISLNLGAKPSSFALVLTSQTDSILSTEA